MNKVVERVEFEAVWRNKLTGADQAVRKLEALSSALKRVQSQIAGLSNNTLFKLSAKQFQEQAFNASGKPVLNATALTRKLGFGSDVVKDVKDSARLMVAEIQKAQAAINRQIEQNPAYGKRALAARQKAIADLTKLNPFTTTGSFKDTLAAGRFFGGGLVDPAVLKKNAEVYKLFQKMSPQVRSLMTKGYAPMALANKELGQQALMAILTGGGGGSVMTPGASLTPAHLSKAVADAVAAAAVKGKTESAKESGRKKSAGQKAHTAEGDDIVETRTTTPADEKKPIKTVVKRNIGNGVIEETVHENDEEVKTTVTDAVGKRAKAELRARLKQLQSEFQRNIAGANSGDLGKHRQDILREAELLKEQYGPLGLGDMVENFQAQTVPKAVQSELKRLGKQKSTLVKARAKAEADEDAVRVAQLKQEMKTLEANRRRLNQFLKAGGTSQQSAAVMAEKVNAFDARRLGALQFRQATYQAARDFEAHMGTFGVQPRRVKTNLLTGERTGATFEHEGQIYTVEYGAKGARVESRTATATAARPNRLQHAIAGLSPLNMAANVVKVTSWAAAVGTLYKSVELARYALERMDRTGLETAHLGIVFRKVGGDAQELTADILQLTSAQGRETSEMMESATEWARLGGDRAAINEEVRVSAMAANIANLHMSETTKQLAALMHIYGLEAGDLNGVLGMLTNTSLKYNVTLEDLFGGLDRSAGAAKIAGVNLAELQAMIGTVVGKTGQSGIVVGNTIKSLLVQFSNPAVQKALRGFGVEVLGNGLQQKPGGQIISELHDKWTTMDSRSKQDLTRTLVGRLSAARFTPLMDDYLETQKLAIDAQLNLNKAQEANGQILNTMKAQLAGVRAEFDRLVVSMMNTKSSLLGGATPMQAVVGTLRTIKTGMKIGGMMAARDGGVVSDVLHPVRWMLGKAGVTGGLTDAIGRMNDYFDPQGALDNKVATLNGRVDAYAKLQKFYDSVKSEVAGGKMTQERANLATYGMAQPLAKQFLEAWQGHDQAGQLGALAAAKEAARKNFVEASAEKQRLFSQNQSDLSVQLAAKNNEVTARKKRGENTDDLDKEVADLKERLDLNHRLATAEAAADEQVAGDTETVTEMQQKYVNLLKEQADTMELIGNLNPKAFGEAQQKVLTLTEQVKRLNAAEQDYIRRGFMGGKPEEKQVWQTTHDERVAKEAELASAQRILAAGLLTLDRQYSAQGYGYDEADKLGRQRLFLTNKLATLPEESARNEQEQMQALKANELLMENSLAIRQRQADVEREIKQLAIDQNREFAKSVYGAGPAELLKKLAAFRLAAGGLSQGQMFSLSPGLRNDVGLLNGTNYEMSRLRLEQGKLNGMARSLPGFATGGYTGSGPANEVAGVVHKGEYVLSQRDLFHLTHDRLYARGAMAHLPATGGVYRPLGIPLDNLDALHQPRVTLPPRLRMAPAAPTPPRLFAGWEEREWLAQRGGRVATAGQLGQFFTQPRNWAAIGMGLARFAGRGLAAGAITGGLNYGGRRLGLDGSTAGGAIYGVGADATGGSVFGPVGAAVSAGLGLAGRVFGGVRDLYREQTGGERLTQQVNRAQEALLRAKLDNPGHFGTELAARRQQHAQEFQARLDALDARIAASTERSNKATARGVDWAHPAMVVDGVRTYKMPDGRYANFYPGDQTPHYHDTPKLKGRLGPFSLGYKNGGYTGDGPADEVAGVVHRGEYVIPKKDLDRQGHDFGFVKNCEAALNSLAGSAGRVQAAFDSLAARVDRVFAGGGMKFSAPGQSGGWYPGKAA
jgi:TP901 family phage tail tape measure protein